MAVQGTGGAQRPSASPSTGATVGEREHLTSLAHLAFYKHYFGKLLWVLIGALLLAACLGLGMVYLAQQAVHGKREYFAVDSKTGRLTPMVPLGDPYITDGALLSWVSECVVSANTYNFVSFREQFTQSAVCFTDSGWAGYSDALTRAGSVKLVREGRLIATANSVGAPVITNKSKRAGVYTWKIEMPISVTFQGGQGGRSVAAQRQLVTVLVQRIPTWQNEHGVGIAQYVAKEQ